MRLRVVVLIAIGTLLLTGFDACGNAPLTGGEEVAAAIPVPETETETETGAEAEAETETETETESGAGSETPLSTATSECTQVPADLPLDERCKMAGAAVHTFTNACVGGCRAKEQMMMCGQAMTQGCRCPDGQCIDEATGCCRAIR